MAKNVLSGGICRRNFGSTIKVARKSHIKKDEEAVADFKKNFGKEIEKIALRCPLQYDKINLYFADESRFGLFTKNGKAFTAKGVKPVCPFLQVFKSTYLLGAFSPITGHRFMLEMLGCNGDSFQIFLTEFSNQNPDGDKIIVLDNGAFYR